MITSFPIIGRELRVQARLPFTYWLRVLGASALMAGALMVFGVDIFLPHLGGLLFSFFNEALLFAIMLMVPLMTADCVSRERREGTLGLLFLTHLSARGIILAKGIAHGIRALTMWLAITPVITIPILMGGVSWYRAVSAELLNLGAICVALAAGIIASAYSKDRTRAMLLAGSLAFLFALFFILGDGVALRIWQKTPAVSSINLETETARCMAAGLMDIHMSFMSLVMLNNVVMLGRPGIIGAGGFTSPFATTSNQLGWVGVHAGFAGACFIALLVALFIAAWKLNRIWREEPPSARRAWIERQLTTPIVAVGFFKRWMRHKLERNPIGWLEQRRWSGRTMTWGWFAVMISLYSVLFQLPNADRVFWSLQDFFSWSLLVLMGVSASGSFQRERETKVLELLLISPMTAKQIIWGRLRGLWGQFMPALVLMIFMWMYFGRLLDPHARSDSESVFYLLAAYTALPVFGLYSSLKRKSFAGAFASTSVDLAVVFVSGTVTSFLLNLIFYAFSLGGPRLTPWSVSAVYLFMFAVLHYVRLWRDLEKRNFAYNDSGA